MKVWISKYALGGGITEHEVQERGGDGYVYLVEQHMMSWFRLGRNAHETYEAAAAAAEQARIKKIASLEKQLAKLHRLSFAAVLL